MRLPCFLPPLALIVVSRLVEGFPIGVAGRDKRSLSEKARDQRLAQAGTNRGNAVGARPAASVKSSVHSQTPLAEARSASRPAATASPAVGLHVGREKFLVGAGGAAEKSASDKQSTRLAEKVPAPFIHGARNMKKEDSLHAIARTTDVMKSPVESQDEPFRPLQFPLNMDPRFAPILQNLRMLLSSIYEIVSKDRDRLSVCRATQAQVDRLELPPRPNNPGPRGETGERWVISEVKKELKHLCNTKLVRKEDIPTHIEMIRHVMEAYVTAPSTQKKLGLNAPGGARVQK